MTAPDTALIGHTGFIGGTLARVHRFDALYNSSNIEDIRGKAFRLVVCAGAPSLKWYANANPEIDHEQVARLRRCLREVVAEAFVLVSTVAVYAAPDGVDEDTPVDVAPLPPYGRHRLELEQDVRSRFPHALIVRLPGVFGPGLRKNVIFDLLRGDVSHAGAAASTLQFYDVTRLWDDIARAERHGIRLLNIATEPASLGDIDHVCTRSNNMERFQGPVVHDDMQTTHAREWGKTGRYLYSRDDVLADLRAFVSLESGVGSLES